jgi:hypothetical protein
VHEPETAEAEAQWLEAFDRWVTYGELPEPGTLPEISLETYIRLFGSAPEPEELEAFRNPKLFEVTLDA